MSRLTRLALLLPLAGLLAAESSTEPAPATVTNAQGRALDCFVKEDSITGGITYIIGDWKDDTSPKVTEKPGSYTVVYKPSENLDLLTGQAQERTGKYDLAVASFAKAAATSRFDWERQEAYIDMAEAADKAKNYAGAVKALRDLIAHYPATISLPTAMYQLGHELAASGDNAGAVKEFKDLTSHAQDWGVVAAVMGSLGLAETLVADGKPADAVTELKPWLTDARLAPAKHPQEFAKVGLALGDILAGQKDAGAADAYRTVAYAPCGAAAQSAAQLAWAKLLAGLGDPGSLLDAFDHAAIAAVLPDADPAVRAEAIGVASDLVGRIGATGADDKAKLKLTAEYRGYLAKLQ